MLFSARSSSKFFGVNIQPPKPGSRMKMSKPKNLRRHEKVILVGKIGTAHRNTTFAVPHHAEPRQFRFALGEGRPLPVGQSQPTLIRMYIDILFLSLKKRNAEIFSGRTWVCAMGRD
jgi:hypothetical protein